MSELQKLFEAERVLASEERSFLSLGDKVTKRAVSAAVTEARGMRDRDEAVRRLRRLADLAAQIGGPEMVEALIEILDDQEPHVRVEAGEALRDLAFDRYAEVARVVELAIQKGEATNALMELPFILAEIGEPSALPMIRSLLTHKNADIVAASIESLVVLGDAAATKAIEKLVSDKRVVTLDDEQGVTTATLGELAADAIAELTDDDD